MKHNAEAEWLQDLKNELDALGKQGEVKISALMIKKQLRKIVPNWKCGSRWYAWLLAEKVYRVTCLRSVLEWLTKGRIVLVVKDKGKGGELSHFRPITYLLCVPLMRKLFTAGMLVDTIL